MIRAAFWLVKPQTQDVRPNRAITPNMLVDYLWISLGPSWAQAAEGLWESGQNRPIELIRQGRAGWSLWNPLNQQFRSPGRFEPRPGSWPTPACPRRRRSGAS